MDNKEFKLNFDKLLKGQGYKKKGNVWKKETSELLKMIELQKSNFRNLYYLNFGFNFNNLDYSEVRSHIVNRLGGRNPEENTFIDVTLDLENDMSDEKRKLSIQKLLNEILIPQIEQINSESDVLNELKSRSHLNDIPIKVKAYLKL
ncbi:MAG: DUF4304 domain-containing protein [Saprospiraceae bacterium]